MDLDLVTLSRRLYAAGGFGGRGHASLSRAHSADEPGDQRLSRGRCRGGDGGGTCKRSAREQARSARWHPGRGQGQYRHRRHWSPEAASARGTNGRPQKTAAVVATLRRAGAIILGHTTMHEGALGATQRQTRIPAAPTTRGATVTHPAARRAALPPRSPPASARSPSGTDTMGSVRLPAAYCGIAGFKPSHGLIVNTGIEPLCRRP